jgi:hypothetical protein
MIWDAVAFAALGFLAAWTASRIFPLRLPLTPLLLATGPVGALTGGLVTYTVVGGGYPEATFPAALAAAAVLISLLAGPSKRGRHAKMRATGA